MINRGNNILWYRQEARSWNEALPLGNGRLGAMVYGGARRERLCLNEDTLWSGYPAFYENKTAAEGFKKAQALVLAGKNEEAQRVIERECEGLWSQVYLALGDITLDFEHEGEISAYKRALDISEGISLTEYECENVKYERESFISCPHQVLAMRISASRAGKVSFALTLSPALDARVSMSEDSVSIQGNCPAYVWHYGDPQQPRGKIVYGDTDETRGMGYFACVRVISENGQVFRQGGSLRVVNADSAVLLFDARTSFNGWNRHPVTEGRPYIEPCSENLNRASKVGYFALKAEHIRDHKRLYDRAGLELDGGEERFLPTDERLYRHEDGKSDPALYALYFNYARYLTIAASREGTQAMNLQGIWNNSITPPWNCNYTININTEMNYWPTLMTNLIECHEPLIRLISELSQSGERAAKEYYGASGWVSHHNTDLWRLSTPVGANIPGSAVFAFWCMSSGWLCRHLWEHYEYTRDVEFLKTTALPIMKKAAEFYLALLIEDEDGKLILSPTTSPENTYVLRNVTLAVSKTTAMTQGILRDLFSILVAAEETLKIRDEVCEQARCALPLLKPFEIGGCGELMEWDESYQESDIHHRHISHLYAMHPAHLITPEKTPELAEACRVTLERRGDESTGWAMGWRICQWARLGDGDRALKLLDNQLRTVEGRRKGDGEVNRHFGGGSYLNLFDAHPPFQIDGNFGACAGIAELLLKTDERGEIQPLPALPASWKKGRVHGLRARNGKTVDIEWSNGRVRVNVSD
ncbi:MAG: glycoside hydrolase family 95 protein [Clostridia bacterium]|nr:glycoside hydrolase family 95 protein [Clostridia bacterium]